MYGVLLSKRDGGDMWETQMVAISFAQISANDRFHTISSITEYISVMVCSERELP